MVLPVTVTVVVPVADTVVLIGGIREEGVNDVVELLDSVVLVVI